MILASSFDRLRMRSRVFNGLILMVSLSRFGGLTVRPWATSLFQYLDRAAGSLVNLTARRFRRRSFRIRNAGASVRARLTDRCRYLPDAYKKPAVAAPCLSQTSRCGEPLGMSAARRLGLLSDRHQARIAASGGGVDGDHSLLHEHGEAIEGVSGQRRN